MSFKKLTQKLLANLSDLLQATLSFAMSNIQWLTTFNASPAAFVVKPLLGLVLLGLVLFQAYELSQANQVGFADLLDLMSNSMSVGLTNASIFGWIGAVALNTSFVAGPWIFIAALGFGLIQQTIKLGFNLYAGINTESGLFRAHYLQAAISNLFNAILLALTISAVTLSLFTPAAPMALMTLSLITASLLIVFVLWRSMPNSFRQAIKQGLGLGKPEFVAESLENMVEAKLPLATSVNQGNGHTLSLWSKGIEEDKIQSSSLQSSIL